MGVHPSFSPAPQPMRFRSATPQMQASNYSYGSMPPPPAPSMMAPMPMPGFQGYEDPNSYGASFVAPPWNGQVNGVHDVSGGEDRGNDSYDKSYEAVDADPTQQWQAPA